MHPAILAEINDARLEERIREAEAAGRATLARRSRRRRSDHRWRVRIGTALVRAGERLAGQPGVVPTHVGGAR